MLQILYTISHNDRMCHVHDGLIRLRTLAKQIDCSNTEIYSICKLQCSASFLFWCRASNSSTNDSKSIVCARFDSIDKRGGVDGTDSARAARSDCSTNVRWGEGKLSTDATQHPASRPPRVLRPSIILYYNVIMKWIEKKRSNDTRDKSASGVIWASNNTNDINMQH